MKKGDGSLYLAPNENGDGSIFCENGDGFILCAKSADKIDLFPAGVD
jgi:hypothetical protein